MFVDLIFHVHLHRTFISRPRDVDDETLKKSKNILKKVSELLNQPDKKYNSLTDLLAEANITRDEYIESFSIATRKPSVILKRDVQSTWINQYNPDLLRAWNANIDVQYILDPYSCIMYILSYLNKPERELSLLLEQVSKEAKYDNNLDAKAALKKLGSAYLYNREVSAQEAVYRVLGNI